MHLQRYHPCTFSTPPRRYFARKFERLIRATITRNRLKARQAKADESGRLRVADSPRVGFVLPPGGGSDEHTRSMGGMIRRVDCSPILLNPSGRISEGMARSPALASKDFRARSVLRLPTDLVRESPVRGSPFPEYNNAQTDASRRRCGSLKFTIEVNLTLSTPRLVRRSSDPGTFPSQKGKYQTSRCAEAS